jgi:hypothetical protein
MNELQTALLGAACGTLCPLVFVGTLVAIDKIRWYFVIESRRREWREWCASVRENR